MYRGSSEAARACLINPESGVVDEVTIGAVLDGMNIKGIGEMSFRELKPLSTEKNERSGC